MPTDSKFPHAIPLEIVGATIEDDALFITGSQGECIKLTRDAVKRAVQKVDALSLMAWFKK